MNLHNSFPPNHRPAFPADLAKTIENAAVAIGKRAEQQAHAEMIRIAKGCLGRGMSPTEIEAQLNLK